MRKILFVLLVLAVPSVSVAQYGMNYSGRSRSAATARSPGPYDYISRAYTARYIEKTVGAGYSGPAMQSVDAGYRASRSSSEIRGTILFPVQPGYTSRNGIKYSPAFPSR
jgi:hypothetical protein